LKVYNLPIDVISGHDTNDSTSVEEPKPSSFADEITGSVKGLTIGIPRVR
jgi:hypothetical protein